MTRCWQFMTVIARQRGEYSKIRMEIQARTGGNLGFSNCTWKLLADERGSTFGTCGNLSYRKIR